MTKHLPKLLFAALLATLSGCTIVPGSHISTTPGWFLEEDEGNEEAESLPDVVKVHNINTRILQTPEEQPSQPADTLLEEPEDYDYVVGLGDVLQITVWDHPELTDRKSVV